MCQYKSLPLFSYNFSSPTSPLSQDSPVVFIMVSELNVGILFLNEIIVMQYIILNKQYLLSFFTCDTVNPALYRHLLTSP